MTDVTPDWDGLMWETRGYLGLEADEAVPTDELVETATANGYREREIREALRETDALEAADAVDAVREADTADPAGSAEDADEEGDKATATPGVEADEPPEDDAVAADISGWAEADFSATDPKVWAPAQAERDAWMCRKESKRPYAPWADADAPVECNHEEHDEPTRCNECEHAAGYKWGSDGSREHVHNDHATAREWADMDPSLSSDLVYIQRDTDPFAFVDGDDVRDPDTDEIHPAFEAILEHLGVTYADISTSGSGVHAVYRGEIPLDGVPEAKFKIDDEPWGANDEEPAVEIYDGKHVCIATGDRVVGTGTEIAEWDDDALADVLRANGFEERPEPSAETSVDLEGYEPTATTSDETTDDIRDVFRALDRLDPKKVGERTIVSEWTRGRRSFLPTWGSSSDNGTANYIDDRIWHDTGHDGGYGGPAVMAAIDAGLISHHGAEPSDVSGETFFRALDHLRDLGFSIPELDTDAQDDSEAASKRAVSALPTGQLDALAPEERRRAARKRGLEWPSTDEARGELFDTLADVLRNAGENGNQEARVIDAPTSLGKSHTVAATRWGARDDLTDDRPVVHLSATRKARDEAATTAHEEGGEHIVLKSRHEACPVAAGDHDPDPEEIDDEGDAEDRVVITMNGEPASEWLDSMCNTEDGRGLPFSAAHQYLAEHNDQDVDLPCHDDGECPAIHQYTRLREGDHPLVVATHNFAHVPSLRTDTNVVIDEEPDYTVDLGTDRVRRAVGAYLREIGAPVTTWESFIQTARSDTYGDDAAGVREALKDALATEPRRAWYFEHADAHTLAPALARAIFNAEERSNGLRHGKTPYQPPRLEAEARESDGWNRTWVSVVLDETNDVRTVRSTPDMSAARSVVGLDAHPALPIWRANTVPWIDDVAVLDPEARRLWRRYERGLRVVQVGDATRPLTSGEYYDDRGVEAITEHLRETYGDEFSTAITAKSVEGRLEETLDDVGIDDPELMHYGHVKSRNDFAGESVGFVNGCIDSGDGPIVDLLAELDLEAEPERSDAECETCGGDGCHDCDGTGLKRAHGRGFVGPDAEAAEAILASVRENQVAQAAGRYARDPEDPEETATVFVRTDATPPGFADIETAGVEWLFESKQETVVETLREKAGAVTAAALAQETDVSKRHVHRTLERLAEHGTVQAFEGEGPNGATLYADDGVPNRGVVDLTAEGDEVVTDAVCAPYTWSVTIQDADRRETSPTDDRPVGQPASTGLYRYADPPDDATAGGDPPAAGGE